MQIGFARATEQLFQKPVYSDTIKKTNYREFDS